MGAPHRTAWLALRLDLRTLSLATLVLVVSALAVLQYRWIDQVSNAEETRAKSHLHEEAKLLADAFDTEVTRGALAFEIPPGEPSSTFVELEQAWAAWKRGARWPRLISGIVFLESSDSGSRARLLGSPVTSDPRSVLPVATEAPPASGGRSVILQAGQNREIFFDNQPAVLRPLFAFADRSAGFKMNWVLIRFDQAYLTNVVFPRLLEEYSTVEDRAQFRFEIELVKGPAEVHSSGASTGAPPNAASANVIIADLFHYRPDCLPSRPFRPPGMPPPMPGWVGQSPPLASLSAIHEGAPPDSMLNARGHCQTPQVPSDHGLLQLVVRERSGSWSDVYNGFRRRNLFVSGLVLAALLAALSALILSADRARKFAELQTVVAAGISHELRTPLASLRVAADDLKSGFADNAHQSRRYGEIIDAQSRRLGHIVDQAVALSTVTHSNGNRHFVAVSLSELLDTTVDAFAAKLSDARIEVETHIASDLPWIVADPELVLRCLANLVENSIKYAGSGQRIVLSARASRSRGRAGVEVTVEDRGPGIRQEEASDVFEPFYRGASARLSRQPGSGLGLAIVKRTVEAHGGWIRLERAIPQGCKFRLFLPADRYSKADPLNSEAAG